MLLTLGLFVGCSGRSAPIPVTPPQQTSAAAAKAALKEIADSGQVGSQLMTVRENVEKLKGSDPAKADALLKEVDELGAARTPDAVKAKAKAMMDKL